MTREKGSAFLAIVILVFLIFCLGLGTYYFLNQKSYKPRNSAEKIKITSSTLQSENAKEKIENAVKLIKTRDRLGITSFAYFLYQPGSKEEIYDILPTKLSSKIFLDLNSKNYTIRIDSELIQKSIDNKTQVGYLDVDFVYIDSLKRSYLQETVGGQTAEAWTEIDENNPPDTMVSTRTDPMKHFIEDSVYIYDKKTLSGINTEQSIDSKEVFEVITASIDPASLSRIFRGSFGENGKYIFDFSASNPEIKFLFEGSRLRQIINIFQGARVLNVAGEVIGSFNGGESIKIYYTDDGLEAKEIKVPEGKIKKI